MPHLKSLTLVVSFSLLIAIGLTAAAWDMNFWPTDAEIYYIPAAIKLPSLKYISQMHAHVDEARIRWLHGKEFFIVGISWAQRLVHDWQTLRPLLLLGAANIFLSGILIFMIAFRLCGAWPAWVCYGLFTTSCWPILYVLMAKHQTQGLMFFLMSVWLLTASAKGFKRGLAVSLAGAAMSVSLYSSTVSALYLPYVGAAFAWSLGCRGPGGRIRDGLLFAAGLAAVMIYVNWPDVPANLKAYWEYVNISGQYNHFFYNQRALAQWIPSFNLKDTRAGWPWVFKYFFLVIPVIFTAYLASVVYLASLAWRERRFWIWGLIVLSFSAPLFIEIKRIAQYGANYFPVLPGLLLLIGYALSRARAQAAGWSKPWGICLFIAFFAAHIGFNAYAFAADIYPARMAAVFLSRAISHLDIRQVYTYRGHPLRKNMVDCLSPSQAKVEFVPIDTLAQARRGYVVVPPISCDSIYRASNGDYTDFDSDLVLNRIVRQGRLKDYAVASFKTLSSSLIWSQEEEILAYRYLMLGQFQGNEKSYVWLLDAQKIQRDMRYFLPTAEDIFLFQNHVANIGTTLRVAMHHPLEREVGKPTQVKGLVARVFKIGDPQDSLVAYMYQVDDQQPAWIPVGKNFASLPIPASRITSNPSGDAVTFIFDPPVHLAGGAFSVVIYRTAHTDDRNFYRIWEDFLAKI